MRRCENCIYFRKCDEYPFDLSGCKDYVSVSLFIPPKHGWWIRHPDDLFPAESTQECSVCHEHEYLTLCNESYCPNCGAKMDGEGNV